MVTPIESDGKERLQAEFDTTIMLPDTGVIDAPHLSMVWGAFDANVFWSNRERLLTLRNDSSLTPNDRELLQTLSDKALRPYLTFLQRTAEWTEVKRNIASSLGIQDQTQYGRSLTSADFFHLFEQKMSKATGNTVIMGTSHSILYSAYASMQNMFVDKNAKIAEIVLDRHVDTTVNVDVVTSGNFYWHMVKDNLIHIPIILGVNSRIYDTFVKIGGMKAISRIAICPDKELMSTGYEEMYPEIIQLLRRLGITNITFSTDLDVLSAWDGGISVRYSGITPYLALGCQELPDRISREDIQILKYLRYPNPQVRYLFQKNHIPFLQDPQIVRRLVQSNGLSATEPMQFGNRELDIAVGDMHGLTLQRGLDIITGLKKRFIEKGFTIGMPLTNGAVYKGSVVEMCGFEDTAKKTSDAAIRFAKVMQE